MSLCSSIGSVSDRTYPHIFESTFLPLFSIHKATRKRILNGTQKHKKLGSLFCTAHFYTCSNQLFCYCFWYIKPIEQEFWTALKSLKKGLTNLNSAHSALGFIFWNHWVLYWTIFPFPDIVENILFDDYWWPNNICVRQQKYH